MIDIKELIILALTELKSNLARTMLTMLGIVIGIGSVITIMSLGEGSTQSIVDQISTFGTNVITVSPGRARRGPGMTGGTFDTLVKEDTTAILELPNIEAVSGIVSGQKNLVFEENSTSSSINGVEYDYAQIQSLEFSQGDFLNQSSIYSMTRSVVLGDELVEDLFGQGAMVVGQKIRIDGKTFKIVGVIKDSSSVIIPISTAQKILFGHDYYSSISVRVIDNQIMEQTLTNIENLLLERHEISDPDNADFDLRSPQQMIESMSSVTGVLTTVLSGIAAISLLVGGIGIMNIMLVTVTERTKDIGLLKAIGAKRKDILSQFLIESLVLTLFGGIFGVIIGAVLTYFASTAMGIHFIVSLKSILLAVGVSAAVGLLFGWYPAKKASELNPIDALRYE
ncbi:ABC transporter permease [Patescibacteria group bacterium]|nr:ABC transporter permease [Patescibacteria group bacterium]MCG2702214.1 ABC transporter permease [Candidatus Parcubacteria bacterium]MBU4390110.1 ABC transporter permease [Patescibacteria group bacterium]MBU4397556.1 ABC transporter permease [Patescibacteria group bacterium]MBU4431199.1 ABC transporter permease [Patescibacteria group bacterium]